MKKFYEAEGRTREEAIDAGLNALDLTIGDVTVEDIQQGSKGLFGLFGSRPWKVRLTVIEDENDVGLDAKALLTDTPKPVKKPAPAKKPAEKKPAPEQKPAEKKLVSEKKPAEKKPAAEKKSVEKKPAIEKKPVEKKPITPAEQADPATIAGQAQAFLQDLTKLMGVEVAVNVKVDEEGNVRVNMEGDSQGILIGRRGETLDALQYLTSLKVNKGRSEYTRVTLDTEGYRARREEALIRLANRMANRAVKTGRRVSMEPMNPYERRILHSALQGNTAVTTHSEGEEPNRHVVITVNKPARAKKPVEAAEPVAIQEESTEA